MAQGLQHIPLGRSIPQQWDAAWFAKFIREVLALADVRNAIEGAGITISGQPGEVATISTSADVQALLQQAYVTAEYSAFLPNERKLSGENGVVSITDSGAGGPITVGIYDGGIPYSKLNNIDELSVLGNPTPDYGPLTPINGTAEHDVLSVQLNGSDLEVRFGTITHQSVSDFDEAAQDAVGGILTDTGTIDFTYDDATASITAEVNDDSISYAKIQETSSSSVLIGRGSSSAGNPQEISLGSGLTMTGTTLSSSGGGGLDPATSWDFFTDCEYGMFGASAGGGMWNISQSGSGALINFTAIADHPGIIVPTTGTSSSGRAGASVAFSAVSETEMLVLSAAPLVFTALVNVPTLPDGTNTFELALGFLGKGNTGSTSGICAKVAWNGSAAIWRLTGISSGSSTNSDAASGPTAATWHLLQISCTSTAAELFIDGVSVATLSTGLPSAGFTLGFHILKSAGSSSRTALIDFMRAQQTFSPSRY